MRHSLFWKGNKDMGGFFGVASKEDCEKMTKMGVQPWAGASICDEEGVDEVIERGCTLITCNNPDEILGLLRKKNKHI